MDEDEELAIIVPEDFADAVDHDDDDDDDDDVMTVEAAATLILGIENDETDFFLRFGFFRRLLISPLLHKRFVEALRKSTTVESIEMILPSFSIEDDFSGNGGDFNRFWSDCALAMGTLPMLKKLDVQFWDEASYLAGCFFLWNTRQVSSLTVRILGDELPPQMFNQALMGHPTLEELCVDFAVNDDDIENLVVPFVTSLPTLPKLRELEFHNCMDRVLGLRNLQSVQGLPGLEILTLENFRFDERDNFVLPEIISNCSKLCCLYLEGSLLSIGNCDRLLQRFGKSRTDVLGITPPTSRQFYEQLLDAFRVKQHAASIIRLFPSGDDEVHSFGLNHLLKGLQMHDKLMEMELIFYQWDDTLCRSLHDYLAVTTELESLEVDSESSVTDVVWRGLCFSLSKNETVTDLNVRGCMTMEGLVGGLSTLKSNKKLESLTVNADFPDIPNTLLSALQVNCGFTKLGVYSSRRVEAKLSAQKCAAVLELLRRNFTLTKCDFSLVLAEGECQQLANSILSDIKSIFHLNAHGRRYLLDNKTSKKHGFALLKSVSDNLESVFFHLKENPDIVKHFKPEIVDCSATFAPESNLL